MILITGSSGHLGEALCRVGRAREIPMRGTDLLPGPTTDHLGDLSDPDFAAKVAKGCTAIIHAATLHKPHVATHSRQDFVDTNITATLHLLETAKHLGLPFVFCSTTSAFGAALSPPSGAPAAWITEDVVPVPKNIYGATKTSAEEMCHLFARRMGVPVVILRLSRFFPEPDDDPIKRAAMPDGASKLNEFTFRRIGLEDAVEACLCALNAAPDLAFGRFIISGPTPFKPADCAELRTNAPAVLDRRLPGSVEALQGLGWSFFGSIDRVYDSSAAQSALGWTPRQDFTAMLKRAQAGQSVLGDLADVVGIKGYHGTTYADGIYPTD